MVLSPHLCHEPTTGTFDDRIVRKKWKCVLRSLNEFYVHLISNIVTINFVVIIPKNELVSWRTFYKFLGFQLCSYVWMKIRNHRQFHGSDHNSNSELIIMNQDTKMFVLNIESFSNYYEWNGSFIPLPALAGFCLRRKENECIVHVHVIIF